MLIKEITDQRNAARLVGSQFEYSLLTLVYGELETAAKRKNQNVMETKDADVVAGIKKIIKGNNEILTLVDKDSARADTCNRENSILQKYLPVEMTEDEVKAVLEDSVFGSVKEGLAALDAKHLGLYNKQAAVKLINSLL